jgi:hypothetical protein
MFMDPPYLCCLDPAFRKKPACFFRYGNKILRLQVLKGRQRRDRSPFSGEAVPCLGLPGLRAYGSSSLLHSSVLLIGHGVVPL